MVTTQLLLAYSLGPCVPYRSPPPLQIFRECLGVILCLFIIKSTLATSSTTFCVQRGQSCPTSGHGSSARHFSVGYGDPWSGAAVLQLPQKGPEFSWSQSSTVICGRAFEGEGGVEMNSFSYLLHSVGRSTLYLSVSRFIFTYSPLLSYLRVARSPLESSTGRSNTVPY